MVQRDLDPEDAVRQLQPEDTTMDARTFCATALLTILLAAPASAIPPGDPVAGQTAFNKSCGGCHGLLPEAAYSPSVITSAISSVSQMNALGNALTATDLQNIAAYIGKTVNLQPNYQGLWWAAPAGVESGWGINVAHQYNTIFLTWFTYDATGKGWWLVMTGKPGVGLAANTYSGTIYATTGPAFNAQPFDPSKIKATQVGTGALTFTDTSNGTFAYTVNGVAQNKAVTREIFGPVPTCYFIGAPDYSQTTNFEDLWWAVPAGSESGWGINFTQQGDTIFATWFTYDLDGSALWLVVTAPKTAPNTYSGTLYRTTGPAFSAVPFDPSKVTATAVGSATLTFTDGNNASFAYTVNGVAQVKQITREVFGVPGTICE
jgi:mono/diheme cytochrome c family protein